MKENIQLSWYQELGYWETILQSIKKDLDMIDIDDINWDVFSSLETNIENLKSMISLWAMDKVVILRYRNEITPTIRAFVTQLISTPIKKPTKTVWLKQCKALWSIVRCAEILWVELQYPPISEYLICQLKRYEFSKERTYESISSSLSSIILGSDTILSHVSANDPDLFDRVVEGFLFTTERQFWYSVEKIALFEEDDYILTYWYVEDMKKLRQMNEQWILSSRHKIRYEYMHDKLMQWWEKMLESIEENIDTIDIEESIVYLYSHSSVYHYLWWTQLDVFNTLYERLSWQIPMETRQYTDVINVPWYHKGKEQYVETLRKNRVERDYPFLIEAVQQRNSTQQSDFPGEVEQYTLSQSWSIIEFIVTQWITKKNLILQPSLSWDLSYIIKNDQDALTIPASIITLFEYISQWEIVEFINHHDRMGVLAQKEDTKLKEYDVKSWVAYIWVVWQSDNVIRADVVSQSRMAWFFSTKYDASYSKSHCVENFKKEILEWEVRELYESWSRDFFLDISTHWSGEGLSFGWLVSAYWLFSFLEKEYPDASFTIYTVACHWWWLVDWYLEYKKSNPKTALSINIFTEVGGDDLNYTGQYTRDWKILKERLLTVNSYSTHFKVELMKGLKKWKTFGEAFNDADKTCEKLQIADWKAILDSWKKWLKFYSAVGQGTVVSWRT